MVSNDIIFEIALRIDHAQALFKLCKACAFLRDVVAGNVYGFTEKWLFHRFGDLNFVTNDTWKSGVSGEPFAWVMMAFVGYHIDFDGKMWIYRGLGGLASGRHYDILKGELRYLADEEIRVHTQMLLMSDEDAFLDVYRLGDNTCFSEAYANVVEYTFDLYIPRACISPIVVVEYGYEVVNNAANLWYLYCGNVDVPDWKKLEIRSKLIYLIGKFGYSTNKNAVDLLCSTPCYREAWQTHKWFINLNVDMHERLKIVCKTLTIPLEFDTTTHADNICRGILALLSGNMCEVVKYTRTLRNPEMLALLLTAILLDDRRWQSFLRLQREEYQIFLVCARALIRRHEDDYINARRMLQLHKIDTREKLFHCLKWPHDQYQKKCNYDDLRGGPRYFTYFPYYVIAIDGFWKTYLPIDLQEGTLNLECLDKLLPVQI